MISRRELFSDLDTSVCGSMQFGDASRVQIQGIGSIVFQGKTNKHHVLCMACTTSRRYTIPS
jgi:hypothetical protein